MLDTGAAANMVTAKAAHKLGLKVHYENPPYVQTMWDGPKHRAVGRARGLLSLLGGPRHWQHVVVLKVEQPW